MTRSRSDTERALAHLESLDQDGIYDTLHEALGELALNRIVFAHLRQARLHGQHYMVYADMQTVIDHLALDDPDQGQIDAEEGRHYDRQRA